MRIIGGFYKGRKLIEFKGNSVRPTSDMARESLFNILSPLIGGADFLDAFSGTGAVGIEALSRGARSVIFNDCSLESIKIIKQNLAKINNPTNAIVKTGDAINLMNCGQAKFDVIFLDPPYSGEKIKEILESAKNSLKDDGIIVFEDEKSIDVEILGLKLYDNRKYGRAHFSFFRKEEN